MVGCLYHQWQADEPLVPGNLSPSTSPQPRTIRPWESSVPRGQAHVGSTLGPCRDKDVTSTGGSGSVLTSCPPSQGVCTQELTWCSIPSRPSKSTRRHCCPRAQRGDRLEEKHCSLKPWGLWEHCAAGWGGCCLALEHWPLTGCRTRPGPPLGVGPDTIPALSPQPRAQPSLHLVQCPRQLARGSPAQPASTPAARPQAGCGQLGQPWPGPQGFGPGSWRLTPGLGLTWPSTRKGSIKAATRRHQRSPHLRGLPAASRGAQGSPSCPLRPQMGPDSCGPAVLLTDTAYHRCPPPTDMIPSTSLTEAAGNVLWGLRAEAPCPSATECQSPACPWASGTEPPH